MRKIFLFLSVVILVLSAGLFAADASQIEDLKQKQSLGFDLNGNQVIYRVWANQNVGLDLSAGFSMNGSNSMVSVGAGMVSALVEKDSFAVNIIPGLKFGYATGSSDLTLVGGAALEFMAVLSAISKDLSVSSQVGAYIGISSTNNQTNLLIAAAKDFAISPVIIRYYF
jgi:opacity protein-like surface antigen